MFVTKLYYNHLSNQSNINLCQISTKVPKITFLLCRFSVYYLLPLCILLLVLVVAHLVWQNKSCWTSIILQGHLVGVRVEGRDRRWRRLGVCLCKAYTVTTQGTRGATQGRDITVSHRQGFETKDSTKGLAGKNLAVGSSLAVFAVAYR